MIYSFSNSSWKMFDNTIIFAVNSQISSSKFPKFIRLKCTKSTYAYDYCFRDLDFALEPKNPSRNIGCSTLCVDPYCLRFLFSYDCMYQRRIETKKLGTRRNYKGPIEFFFFLKTVIA